ncbi:Protein of unknown function [Cotesia congregata]|uniref:Uncharacterized protein n=1 Tax=Cotesia congregata TaxID=51543 RepID=A0A8J2HIV3_COTCN|nr:Protein of unknown function [Cotesia congregata]
MSLYSLDNFSLTPSTSFPCRKPMVANNAAMNGGANRNWSQATFFTATTLPLEPKNLSRTPYQPLTAAMKKPIA